MANLLPPLGFGQTVQQANDDLFQTDLASLMRDIYPQGIPQPPVAPQPGPDIRLGRFKLPGGRLDSAAAAVLGALEGMPRERGFGGGLIQGLAGGLAGGRARGMEQRQTEFERQQKAAEEARGERSRAALTLRKWQLDERSRKQRELEDTVPNTPELRQRLSGQNIYVDPATARVPRSALVRDMPIRAPRDEAMSRLTELQIARYEDEAAAGMQPFQRARSAAINTIMDNVRQDPDIRDFITVRDQRRIGKRTGQTSAGDIILMRAIARASDPQTGVREEEFRTFQGAQGALDALGVRLGPELVGAGKLNDKGRAFLRAELENIYKNKKEQHLRAVATYRRLAEAQGLDPNMVVRDFVGPEDGEGDEFEAVRRKNRGGK